jgi:hypothetical protein
MELSLVPAGSAYISYRDLVYRWPQIEPETPPPSWTASDPGILLRAYQPAANTFFIDSEVLKKFDSVELPKGVLTWMKYRSQSARTLYQKTTTGQQSPKHTIDLYV